MPGGAGFLASTVAAFFAANFLIGPPSSDPQDPSRAHGPWYSPEILTYPTVGTTKLHIPP